jgi:flagellin-like protein
MLGKKGMSPLIATILLMAFAVALGAVIMNWSAKIPELGSDCADAGVELAIRQFCVSNGNLLVEFRNTGSVAVSEIALSVSDPPIEIPHMVISQETIGRGQSITQTVPFGFSTSAQVAIVPSLDDDGESVMCSTPISTYDNIPNC